MGYTHIENPRVFNVLGFLWQIKGLQPVTATGSPHKSHEELIAYLDYILFSSALQIDG